jgi:hypothetical protein
LNLLTKRKLNSQRTRYPYKISVFTVKNKLSELQRRATLLEKEKVNIERSKANLEVMVTSLSHETTKTAFMNSAYAERESRLKESPFAEDRRYFDMIEDLKKQYEQTAIVGFFLNKN